MLRVEAHDVGEQTQTSARSGWLFSAAPLAVAALLTFSAVPRAAAPLPEPARGMPIGIALPSLALVDSTGARFALDTLRGAPSVLVLFRAARCPWCRKQLAELTAAAPRFSASGVRLVGLAPDTPEALAAMAAETGTRFPLLADDGERAVSALCGGLSHCVVVADAAGIVRWAGATESWSDAPPPAQILQAASRLRR